jgi:iron complex outermembrane receptor protein
MIYFRYAQGYREGGFNGAPGNAAAAIGFGPETSTGYEVGAKTTWLDGALLLNVALFDVKFKGLQRVVTVALPSGFVGTVTQNAANADTKGIEIQSVLKPVEGLTFRANFGYLDAKYVKYTSLNPATGAIIDLSGQPLTFAPKYTAMGAVDYHTNLGTNGFLGFDTLDGHAMVNWRSSFEMSNSLLPVGHQPGYATTDLSIDLVHDGKVGYSLGFYVKNVFDKYYQDWATAVAGFVEARYDNIGRTFGVSLGAKF